MQLFLTPRFALLMVRALFLVFAAFVWLPSASAQNLVSSKGKISFKAETGIERIEALNSNVSSVLEPATGRLVFRARNTQFVFENSLMQEHFNENYMESARYPQSEFAGNITNNATVNYSTPGTYAVQVKGKLTMHGVSREVSSPGTLVVRADGTVQATSRFLVKVEDFNIDPPSVLGQNLAEVMLVQVDVTYQRSNP
jgi:hypothetical protein